MVTTQMHQPLPEILSSIPRSGSPRRATGGVCQRLFSITTATPVQLEHQTTFFTCIDIEAVVSKDRPIKAGEL